MVSGLQPSRSSSKESSRLPTGFPKLLGRLRSLRPQEGLILLKPSPCGAQLETRQKTEVMVPLCPFSPPWRCSLISSTKFPLGPFNWMWFDTGRGRGLAVASLLTLESKYEALVAGCYLLFMVLATSVESGGLESVSFASEIVGTLARWAPADACCQNAMLGLFFFFFQLYRFSR